MALTDTNALCTLVDIKTALGITDSSKDTLLERLILVASEKIEGYCNRKFRQEVVTEEKARGYGDKYLSVCRTPLVSISELSYSDEALDSSSYEIEGDGGTGLVFSINGFWIWTTSTISNVSRDPIPGYERDSLYKISYTGGYILPNDSVGTRSLPYDLEEACLQLATDSYLNQGKDGSITEEKLLSYSYKKGVVGQSTSSGKAARHVKYGIPSDVALTLDRYYRMVMGF